MILSLLNFNIPGSHADSFSSFIYNDELELGDLIALDAYYDHDDQQGVFFSMSGDYHYEIPRLSTYDYQEQEFNDREQHQGFDIPGDIFSTAYRSISDTVYVAESWVNQDGIHEFRPSGAFDHRFVLNSLSLEGVIEHSKETVGIAYDHNTDRLLLVVYFLDPNNRFEETLNTYVFDFGANTWFVLESTYLDDYIAYFRDKLGAFAVAPERKEAIYISSVPSSRDGRNRTFFFDFEDMVWSQKTTTTFPQYLVDYEVVYEAKSNHYVLLGGRSSQFGSRNRDLWTYSTVDNTWKFLYRELPVLTNLFLPQFLYRDHDATIIGLGENSLIRGRYSILSISLGISGEVEVDLGLPDPIESMVPWIVSGGLVMGIITYSYFWRKNRLTS